MAFGRFQSSTRRTRYVFDHAGHHAEVRYLPGESDSRLFGGNSNWRGPIWMPINYRLIEALFEFHRYYGDRFMVEYPSGSGAMLSLHQVATLLSQRLVKPLPSELTVGGRLWQPTHNFRVTSRAGTFCFFTNIITVTAAVVSELPTRPAGAPLLRCCCNRGPDKFGSRILAREQMKFFRPATPCLIRVELFFRKSTALRQTSRASGHRCESAYFDVISGRGLLSTVQRQTFHTLSV